MVKENKRLEFLIEEASLKAIDVLDSELKEEKVDFSEIHKKKMNRLFAKQKNKENIICISRITKKIAIVLFLFITISFTLIFSVQAWRAKFLNYIMEKTDSYIEFDFDVKNSYSNDRVNLLYVPDNFEKSKESMVGDVMITKFNNEKDYFCIQVSSVEGKMQVDVEDSEIEEIIGENSDIMIIKKAEKISLVWQDGFYSYVLYGNIEKEELLKIAYNVKNN